MNARNLLASALLTALAGASVPYDAYAEALSGPAIRATTFAAMAGVASTAFEDDAHYVLLRSGTQRSDAPDMALVQHYGAVQLWKASGAAGRAKLAAKPGAIVQGTTVDLPGGTFDPQRISTAKSEASGVGPQVYVVQFVGPVLDAWLDELRAVGARPIQYVNHNAYLVVVNGEAATQRLNAMSARSSVRAISRMTAQQKLQADFAAQLDAAGGALLKGTLVLADSPMADVSKRSVEALVTPHKSWFELMPGQIALQFEADADAIRDLAQLGDAIVVEQRGERVQMDEVQAQIMAGRLTVSGSNTVPSGTGYLDWLTGAGFSTDPADYPIISIVDDGVGNGGTANGAGDFRLTRNGDGTTSRLTFSVSCDGGNTAAARSGIGGHGHINATIAGGYDQGIGFPFRDAQGYLRGQGINPFARLASFEIFNGGGAAACGADDYGVVQAQNAQNVKISSNSWGYCADQLCTNPLVTYNAAAVAYDRGARDANGGTAGSPAMITIFAAGNDGPTANTVATPGLAKNVLTVGASENVRPSDEGGTWNDGCGTGASGANNAMDVIGFSSRGPSVGGRIKPEVIAPGTHIQGSASTAAGYTGASVCDQYRPPGQVSLAASSGTSHSTPAVAGAASLVYRWLQTEYGITDPSPALVKSYFVAHPTYLTGVGANDSLPSNAQGYGMPDLGAAFDAATTRVVVDQTEVFADTGDSWQFLGSVDDAAKPVRIALSWTDAPGLAGSTSPQVNNLDLQVEVNGVTYLGNRFSGAFSTSGGAADTANNYEAVFLPAGTTGPVTVTVLATAINGDGITGNADVTDQDFALVCSNCNQATTFSVSATPDEVAVCAGAAPQFAIDVGALNGYAGNVTLSQTGAPGSSIFSTNPVAAPGASQLTLSTAGVAAGDYTVTIQGDDGADTRAKDILLSVSATLPGSFALLAPANAVTGLGLSVPLSWGSATDASAYTVEVATDPSFGANIVWTETFGGDVTSATPTGLAYGTHYWWRVIATNPCGNQAASAVFSFTTKPQPTVLLVDDSHGVSIPSRWTAPLDAIVGAGKYEIRNVQEAGEPTAAELANFTRVIWFTGGAGFQAQGTGPAGPSAATETVLGNWLDAGACLFISGQDYRWDRGVTSSFMTNHLGATVTTQDVSGAANLTGFDVYNTLNFTLSYTGLFSAFPDRLAVSAGGTGKAYAFRYATTGGGSYSAVSHQVATPQPYFTTWAAFALEAASAVNHQATLQRFFDTCPYISNEAPIAVNDAIAVDAQGGTATTLVGGATSVKANDTDTEDGVPAGDVSLGTGPANGALTLNADGTFEYVHNGLGSSSDSFTYVVEDSAGSVSAPATVSISINVPGNVAPVANAQSVNTDEDEPLAITLVATDSNADPLTYSIVAAPSNGSLDTSALPNVTYTPNADYNGPDSFTFKANDGTVDSNVATVSITVDAVNDPPTFTSTPVTSAVVATAYSYTAIATDIETAAAGLDFTAPTLPGWLTFVDNNDGTATLSGTPSAGDAGTHAVVLSVSDGTDSVQQSFSIDVTAAPVLPLIAVAPANIGFALDSGDTGSQNLTIENIGGGSLDWQILDALPGADPALNEVLSIPDFSVDSPANSGAPQTFVVPGGVSSSGSVLGIRFEGNVDFAGSSTWASDLCMQVEAPDGTTFTVGGLAGATMAGCGENEWMDDAAGNYTEEFADAFGEGVGDSGDWTFTFTNDWNNAGAATINVSDATVTLLKGVSCDALSEIDWLDASPLDGAAGGGETDTVTVDADATGLPGGTYTATLCVASNDTAGNDLIQVPVELQVAAPAITIAPGSLSFAVDAGQTDSLDLDIGNTGDGDLVWNLDTAAPMARPSIDVATLARFQPRAATAELASGTGRNRAAKRADERGDRTGKPAVAKLVDTQVSQTFDTVIAPENSVACPTGPNSVFRRYYFDEHPAVSNPALINSIDVAIQEGVASQTLTVNLYTIPSSVPVDTIELSSLTPIGTGSVTISAQNDDSMVNVPVSAIVTDTGNVDLVVEVTGDEFYIGATSAGATHPAFVAASACGLSTPTPVQELGADFADTHPIIVVNAEDVCASPASVPWLSFAPASGTTTPASTSTASVTVDADGLTPGSEHSANLCVLSNDPVMPVIVVPVTLTVEEGQANAAPVIDDQTFAVDEGSANGTTVGTLVYADADTGDTLTVAVTGGTGQSVFAVSAEGEITVANSAALTGGASFTLNVTVTDDGTPSLSDTAVITITVDDVNEAPVAASPQAFTIAASAADGTAVGTVVASDPDGDDLAFAITAGNADGAFAIDAVTGAITLASSADLTPAGTSYTLTVEVSDGNGGATDVTVEIDVLGPSIFGDGFED